MIAPLLVITQERAAEVGLSIGMIPVLASDFQEMCNLLRRCGQVDVVADNCERLSAP
jgi:hypothetical protein